MLTAAQSLALERMQRQVAKLAFGWDTTYDMVCQRYGIQTLKARRIEILDRFVAKTANSPRFMDTWYPVRDMEGPDIRDRRTFKESIARTSRYYNAPLSYMRRRANDLLAEA